MSRTRRTLGADAPIEAAGAAAPPARAEDQGGMPPAGTVVTGVRVRAYRPHEHNGTLHVAGAEITMTPEAAELAAARGDIEIITQEAEQ